MKMKQLLLTSALVAGVSAGALADGIDVKAGGLVNFRASFFNQTNAYETASSKYDKSDRMITQTRLYAKADAKSDYGLHYGGVVWLDDDTNASAASPGVSVRVRNSYLFMESALGKVELGMMDAPSLTMKVDAARIARGDAGINTQAATIFFMNNTVGFITTSSGTDSAAQYIIMPMLPLDHGKYINTRYNKLAYYTPDISGFQFGMSYGIDTSERGGFGNLQSDFQTLVTGANQQLSSDNLYYENAFTVGGTYKLQLDQMAVSIGAVGQFADAKKIAVIPANYQTIKAVRAFSIGATATWTNWTFAASYASWGKSMNDAEPNQFQTADGRFYTAGVSYVQGPMGLSVTYMDSSRQKNRFSIASFGADYQLAPGLMPYVEGNLFKFKPYIKSGLVFNNTSNNTTALKNKGNVVYVGTKLSF